MPHAQQLLEKAQAGETLSTKDRRHVVAFIMATEPDTTNVEMAKWFKITERAVRLDKKHIREERAKSLKDEDVGLVIADIALSYDTQIRRLETALRNKKECKEGSRTYLEYIKTIFKMQLEKVDALQRLGYYPMNLGNMVIDKYEYQAKVNLDGSIESHRKLLPKKSRESLEMLEAEFTDLPALPAGTEEPQASD